ncbi:lectin-like domain-containing protein [Flavobacterium sp. HNIBRBA15423]|uniref:lectin-like domain-containing protein n=1 Tax=Flavobacterium sp. HNIBRBA15423 TaxID=3458683 RepID=UPI004043FCB9
MKKLLHLFILLFSFISYGQLSEDFEGTSVPTLPTWGLTSGTWAIVDNMIGTAQSWELAPTGQAYAGTRAAYLNRENVPDGSLAQDWLITPAVIIPSDGQLRFFTKLTQAGIQGSNFTIRIADADTFAQNDIGNFSIIQTWNESTLMNGTTATEQTTYIQKVVDLSTYTGQNLFVAFVMENDNGDRWIIDNVNITSKCLDITTQTVSNVSDVSVSLGWDNPSGASQWDIQYGPPGFVINDANAIAINGVTTNPYDLTGLTPATTYEFYVRANCGNDNFSEWIGPFSFTTGICAVSDQCEFTFRMTDSYGDGWNGATMQVNQLGVTLATIGPTFTTGSGPIDVVVSLCSNQPFELFWSNGGSYPNEVGVSILDPLDVTIFNMPNQNGALAGTVLYSAPASCTPPTCPQPSDILISSLTTSTGTVSWSDNTSGNATQWEVIIQPVGTGYPPPGATPTATVSATNYNFTGLNSATEYEVYVRAICGASDTSFWEGPETFETTICDPTDQCMYSFILTDSYGDGWNGNTMNITQNGILVGTIGPGFSGSGPTTVQFPICDGIPFELFWNSGGSFAYEVGIQIIDPFGDDLFTHTPGTGLQNTVLYSSVGSCTPPTCIRPTNLTVLSSQADYAIVSWTENNPGIASWQIVVQPVGTGYPDVSSIIIPANSNPFTITGLDPSMQYEFYVASDCGAVDGISNWAGPIAFETQLINCYNSNLTPLLVGDAVTLSECCYRVTEDDLSQGGAIWYDNVINLNTDFQIIFEASFGDDDNGADGIAFVLKKDATPIIGVTGTGIGYQGIDNSLAVEFDTYDNGFNGDIPADHLAILANGNTEHNNANNLAGPIVASETSANIEDGTGHEVKILWEVATQTLTVIFDCSQRLTYTGDIVNTIFGGDPNVYFGFTGSTGGFSNQQELCFKYLSFINPYNLADKTICAASSVTDIDASYTNATNYSWSPTTGVSDPTIPNPVFTPTTSTTYTVEITDECGFIIEYSFFVEVLDPVVATVTENLSPICIGDDAIFNITGSPNGTVSYNVNGIDDSILLDASGNGIVTSPNATIDQTITLTNITTSSTTLIHHAINATGGIDPVNALGSIEAAGTNATTANATQITITNPLLILELDDLVPAGTSITISAAKNDTAGEITVTDGNTTITLNNGNISELNQTVFVTTVPTNTITLEYTNGSYWVDGISYDFIFSGCSNSLNETAVVAVNSPAAATFNNITLCEGDLNTSLPSSSLEGYTGVWDASNIDSSIAGNYTYTFTPDVGQCATDGTLSVEIVSKDIVTFEAFETCMNSSANFPTLSIEGYTLSGTWSPSTIATSQEGVSNYIFTPDDVCYDTAIFTVTTISCTIQKGISPNTDGLNDTFDLSGFNVSKLEIFNRYGKEVYTKSGYENEWFGQTNNGDELPDGTYYYVIEFADMESRTGWIYINRQQ